MKHSWWRLAVPLQAHGHCSIASHSVPSKTQSGANSQDMKPVVDDISIKSSDAEIKRS